MKRLALSLALICAVALPTLAQAATTTPSPQPTLPPKLLQSSAVNTSRSNIKNNFVIVPDPGGTLHCTADGEPCTQAQVKLLGAAFKFPPPPATYNTTKSSVKTNAITVGNTGALDCYGTPCTTVHLKALNEAAATVNKSDMDAVKIAPSPLPK